jgi:Tol biopolymer transport system component
LVAFYRADYSDSSLSRTGLYVVDTLTGRTRQVYRGVVGSFEWIPGTDTLAIVLGDHIMLMSTTTGVATPLIQHEAFNLSVSPDGARIAFDGARNARSTIYLLDRRTLQLTSPLPDSTVAQFPTWHRTGTRLAALVGTPTAWGIFTFVPDGTLQTECVLGATGMRDLRFSPADDRIAWAQVATDGAMHILIQPTPNGTQQAIYAAVGGPSWSSDGLRLVFSATNADGIRLYLGDPLGSRARQLTLTP